MNIISQQILKNVESLPESMQEETLDFVQFLINKYAKTILNPTSVLTDDVPNGTKLAKIMAEIAEKGTAFRDIKDPVQWQREIRKDRPLPGRD